ncbi:MAG: DUF2177 family protein [Candidatus Izemoplasmatales bacterium]|nr:DUF2177 family protein [Candidatus Izemoplasmatales bacterium]
MNFLKMYLIAFVVFLAIDALWLGLVAPKFYKAQIGHLMAERPNFIAAGIFYLIFIVGVVYFIKPNIEAGELGKAVLGGAIFGFMAYATYDLTNLATLKNWPITVTIVDLIWGTFLSSTITLLTYLIYHWIW